MTAIISIICYLAAVFLAVIDGAQSLTIGEEPDEPSILPFAFVLLAIAFVLQV